MLGDGTVDGHRKDSRCISELGENDSACSAASRIPNVTEHTCIFLYHVLTTHVSVNHALGSWSSAESSARRASLDKYSGRNG